MGKTGKLTDTWHPLPTGLSLAVVEERGQPNSADGCLDVWMDDTASAFVTIHGAVLTFMPFTNSLCTLD